MYELRPPSPLLPYPSKHIRLVKQGVDIFCLRNAISKYCIYSAENSFSARIFHLLSAGYLQRHLMISVACAILKELKRGDQDCYPIRQRKEKFVVVPYAHRIAHNLKKLGMHTG